MRTRKETQAKETQPHSEDCLSIDNGPWPPAYSDLSLHNVLAPDCEARTYECLAAKDVVALAT